MFKFLFKLLLKLPPFSLVPLAFRSWRKLPGLAWVGGLTYLGLKRFAPDVLDQGMQVVRDAAGRARAMATGAPSTGGQGTGVADPTPQAVDPTPAPTDLAPEDPAAMGVTGMVAEPEPVGGQVGMPLSAG